VTNLSQQRLCHKASSHTENLISHINGLSTYQYNFLGISQRKTLVCEVKNHETLRRPRSSEVWNSGLQSQYVGTWHHSGHSMSWNHLKQVLVDFLFYWHLT